MGNRALPVPLPLVVVKSAQNARKDCAYNAKRSAAGWGLDIYMHN